MIKHFLIWLRFRGDIRIKSSNFWHVRFYWHRKVKKFGFTVLFVDNQHFQTYFFSSSNAIFPHLFIPIIPLKASRGQYKICLDFQNNCNGVSNFSFNFWSLQNVIRTVLLWTNFLQIIFLLRIMRFVKLVLGAYSHSKLIYVFICLTHIFWNF